MLKRTAAKYLPLLLPFLILGNESVAASGNWSLYTSVVRINDILAGRDYVWVATDGGVLRFDLKDHTFTTYTTIDRLAGNRVLCIAKGREGELWFGTDGNGLSKFTPAGEFIPPEHFIGYRINSLSLGEGDALYVGTDVGISLFLLNKDEIKETYHRFGPLSQSFEEVFCVKATGQELWAGTAAGAAHASLSSPNLCDPSNWTPITLNKKVSSIVQVDSVVYLGTERGVYSYKNERYQSLRLPLPVVDLLSYQEKLVAVTEGYGVFEAPLSSPFRWAKDPRFPKETSCLSVSPDSALWAGVEGGYLLKIKATEVDTFLVTSPAANTFMDLTFDHQGRLWVASSYRDQTGCRGAYCFDGDQWTNYFAAPNAQGKWSAVNNVVCVTIDSRSRVWLGTWGAGIHLLSSPGTWETIDQTNSILKGIPKDPNYLVINDICEDGDGNIWMLDFLQGVAVLADLDSLPPDKQALYTPSEDGLPAGDEGFAGSVIAVDATGLKWVGTLDAGFCLFDDGGTPFQRGDDKVIIFSESSYPDHMISNCVTDITFDKDGVLWVGTDSGVNAIKGKYNPLTKTYDCESWKIYLRDITVNKILVDSENNKWFATENGLYCFSAKGTSWVHYTRESSGLADNQVKSLAFDELTGNLWIGTLKGLNCFKVPKPSVRYPALAYPNPFISGVGGNRVVFPNLLPRSTVQVFTPLGELVKALTADEFGNATWDGTNNSGNLVASGIYFYSLQDRDGDHRVGKLAVLRRE